MTAVRLLLSSAGRRVALLRCFREDAARLGFDLHVVATDLDPPWSAACANADEALPVLRCTDPGFVDQMLEICAEKRITLLVPTIDTELAALSEAAERFRGIGTVVSVSSPAVVSMARDKAATARFLASIGIPTPCTAAPSEVAALRDSWSGPVIVKPRGGSSSVGIRRLPSIADVRDGELRDDDIVQELVDGDEFTVNLYVDPAGRLRAAVPHLRKETRGGEVSKGETRRHEALEAIAEGLVEHLQGAYGALCFQAIVDRAGRAVVFEINARFGGGFPLTHRAGARFTQWLLEERCAIAPTYGNDWADGVRMLRYDDAAFTGDGRR